MRRRDSTRSTVSAEPTMNHRRITRLLSAALLVSALAGCAPDAWNNRQATGFNGFLNSLATACEPLMIGARDIGDAIRRGSVVSDDYSYFLDVTSQLYYGTMAPEAYRRSITGFFGAGADTSRSIDCIVSRAAANRPPPPGAPPPRM
jgi:hypothetical protein